MANNKYKRTVLGSVVKSKTEGKADYIKIGTDVVLKKDEYINLEGEKFQLDGIKSAVESGKMSPEIAEKAKERINKVPWISKPDGFVRFQLVKVDKLSQG
jgi:hypothetical protein